MEDIKKLVNDYEFEIYNIKKLLHEIDNEMLDNLTQLTKTINKANAVLDELKKLNYKVQHNQPSDKERLADCMHKILCS